MTAAPQDLELDVRLQQARRALLARPLLTASHEAFGVVRAHADRLRAEFHKELGYELAVRAGHARLRKRSDELRYDRPARIPRSGNPDTWQPFTRRHYVLLALALAACEGSRAQTSIGLLAEEVRSLAAEERIALDLDRQNDRRALADVFLFLAWLGVLVPVAGHAEAWVRSRSETDELLYDVLHTRLDDMAVAPGIVGAQRPEDLLHTGAYPPTEEGANLQRKHRVSRRLAEDPVIYTSELEPADASYYTNPAVRGPRDHALAAWLGLEAERRREGTALVDGATEPLSDLRFPVARPWPRQAALLLAERLCRRVGAGESRILEADAVADCRALLDVWGERLSAVDDEREVARRALEVLEAMRLVRRDGGEIEPLAAIARFASVDMTAAQQRLELDGDREDGRA